MAEDPHVPHHEISLAPGNSFLPPSSLVDDTNLPITVRKGGHSCAKYPISKYKSCSALSPSFFLFSIALSPISTHNVSGALSLAKGEGGNERRYVGLKEKQHMGHSGSSQVKYQYIASGFT